MMWKTLSSLKKNITAFKRNEAETQLINFISKNSILKHLSNQFRFTLKQTLNIL